MNSCEEIRDRFALYLDSELQGDERALIGSHLERCEPCRKALDVEREFVEAIRSARPENVAPSHLRTKVSHLLDGVAPQATLKPKRVRPISTVALAVAAAILVLILPAVIWYFVRSSNEEVGQPSSFALMAAESHLRRTRGQLPLEMETANPNDVSRWFSNKVNFSVTLPNYQESSGQEKLYTLEGARLVGFREDYAAYVAYRMSARPISLVITSESVAQPTGGEEIVAKGLTFHYNAIQGLKVITWSDRGLTYALVSDFEERGQQSCVVCHQGTKDRDFIEPLKPKKDRR